MGELEARQVPCEDAVAVKGTLRRACRAGRVDEQGGGVGGRRRGGERRRSGEQPVEVAVDVDRDPVEAELGDTVERLALGEHGATSRRAAANSRASRPNISLNGTTIAPSL